jgi:O-antigen ligase
VSTRLIAERPLLGHGYGAYFSAFPRLADQRFHVFYDHAHNGYLEKAVELGLPATVALYAAVALAASVCLGYRGRIGPEPLPLTAAAGTVAAALHSLVDFSIQIPAVAATYAVILGLGCGQAAAGAGQRGGRTSQGREANPGRTLGKGDGRWPTAQRRDR